MTRDQGKLNMAGHKKFSNLTQNLSAERIAKIAEKEAQLKEEMAIHELSQALKIPQAELAWSEVIMQHQGISDSIIFESYRDELLPNNEIEF